MPSALDIQSLNTATAAVTLALAVAMLAVRATQRTYPGFGLWVGGACAASASLGLVGLQGRLPAWLSVVLANGFMGLYAGLTSVGLERFLGLRPRWRLHLTGVAAMVGISIAFAVAWPAVTLRIVLLSLILVAWKGRCGLLVARHARAVLGAPSRLLPAAFGAFAAWHLGRAALLFGRGDATNVLTANDPAQALLFVVFPGLLAVVAMGLTALERQRAEHDLRASAEELRLLRGIVPICAGCKRIRDGEAWTPVEQWVQERSQAEFSHGLCPACAERLYPEVPGRLRPP